MVTHILALTIIFRILSAQILCEETSQCAHEVITDDVQCLAYKSCEEAVMTGDLTVCYGHRSCDGGAISSGVIYLSGYFAGSSARISSSVNLFITGSYGANEAQIEASNVHGYGYRSLQLAVVEPISDTLVVYLFGDNAGGGLSIKCYSGDECYVYCRGNACLHTDFYCYTGATCTYDCNDNEPCPELFEGTETGLTDAMIDKIFEENRKKIIDENPLDLPPSLPSNPIVYHSPFDSWQLATILCALNTLSMIFVIGFFIRNRCKANGENLNVSKKEDFE